MNERKDQILSALLSGKAAKKYEGKQVVVISGHAHILPSDDKKSNELLNKLIAKHPKSIPTITFVPRHGIYTLLLMK